MAATAARLMHEWCDRWSGHVDERGTFAFDCKEIGHHAQNAAPGKDGGWRAEDGGKAVSSSFILPSS